MHRCCHCTRCASLASSWPPKNASRLFRYGDIRAAVSVASADISAGGSPTATAQIFWRRRDPNLDVKLPVITDAAGASVQLVSAHYERSCGVLTFEASAAGTYYVYYLPWVQKGQGAHLAFHWWNCSDQSDRRCVTEVAGRDVAVSVRSSAAEPSQCGAEAAGASAAVVALESRDAFHSFTAMEFVAAENEVAAVIAASAGAPFAVFAETHARPVRMFDHLPALWARNGSRVLSATAAPGSFFVFQIGVFAHAALPSVTLEYGAGLVGAGGGAAIEAADFRCFNLGGTDAAGEVLHKVFPVAVGRVGALWIGIDVPATASGLHTGTIGVRGLGHVANVTLSLTVAGAAVAEHGAADLYGMARLRWLDSTLGSNESDLPPPFTPVGASSTGNDGTLSISLLHKNVSVEANGLPTSVTVALPQVRRQD